MVTVQQRQSCSRDILPQPPSNPPCLAPVISYVSTIDKSIKPLILAFAGLMFAIIGGLFLPIYDLVSQVGG